jgi:hypothetical protein
MLARILLGGTVIAAAVKPTEVASRCQARTAQFAIRGIRRGLSGDEPQRYRFGRFRTTGKRANIRLGGCDNPERTRSADGLARRRSQEGRDCFRSHPAACHGSRGAVGPVS